jgi:hypothetical protein
LDGEDYCDSQQEYICPVDRYQKCCHAWMWNPEVDE